jgi:DNA-binding MarR family transcriptional regulator
MPRLDASRLGAWRDLTTVTAALLRAVDDELLHEWDISLGWFDVLAALQRLGGRARPKDVAELMLIPTSSLSRRLDRLEEEGWIARHRGSDPGDGRAVEVELTRRGRNLWREMNVSYRRAVQAHFAVHLDDQQIDAIHRVVDLLSSELPQRAD